MTNLRSREQFATRAWDWGFLNECFAPTRVRVSDLDGIVERFGHFLVIEAKPETKPVSRGQEIMFDAFVRAGFTVLILFGEPNEPVAMQQWPNERLVADTARIQRFVADWWRYANAKPELRAA